MSLPRKVVPERTGRLNSKFVMKENRKDKGKTEIKGVSWLEVDYIIYKRNK